MIKLYISRTLKFIALIVPLVVIYLFLQNFLFVYQDYNTDRIRNFYAEEDNSIDVMFMGASEIFTGFAPGQAYESHGFTSYMYAMDANQGALYLSQLKEIQKHQDPQLLFVDIYGFLRADDSVLHDEARLRIYIESIPFSTNKIQTIMNHPYEDKISCFFPLFKHHGNFGTISTQLSKAYTSLTQQPTPYDIKGVVTRTTVYNGPGDLGEEFDPSSYKLSENAQAYLIEFLTYCKENYQGNIVFINFPRCIADESNHSLLHLLDQAEEIIGQYGYTVWNLQDEMGSIGIDKTHDFYNEHHMNIYGQMKLTEYLSNKIVNDYGVIPMPQTTENLQAWSQCAANTNAYYEMAELAFSQGKDIVISQDSLMWQYR